MGIDTITAATTVGNAREESCSAKRLLLQPFFLCLHARLCNRIIRSSHKNRSAFP